MNFSKEYIWYSLIAFTILLVIVLCNIEFQYHYYNNYLIFSRPISVLFEEGNIYDFHPRLYMDTYKYSPTFAIVVGVLSYLPDLVGIIIWNELNVVLLIAGIHFFFEKIDYKIGSLFFLLPMISISVHNEQSNALMAGCMLLCVYFLRNEKPLFAAIFVTICLFMKFYAFIIAIVFLFFSKKKSFIFYTSNCIVIALLFPLLFLKPAYLFELYKQWFHVLQTTKLTIQCSVMGIAESWFSIFIPQNYWAIIGLIILLLPFTNLKSYKNIYFQNLMIASVFIFIILFNKMAGFPTYIVAVVGSCVWYYNLKEQDLFSKSIFLIIFILGICSQYRLPLSLVDEWIIPSNIWVLPFLILWIFIQYQLWRFEFNNEIKHTYE